MITDLAEVLSPEAGPCPCGRRHAASVPEILLERGAIDRTAELVRKLGGSRPFLVMDGNTRAAAGQRVQSLLEREQVEYTRLVFQEEQVEPDETALGRVLMQYDDSRDCIVGIGSGTINDICKRTAYIAGLPYLIVGTAPSMDGYASGTSSMISERVKVSIESTCPGAIIADLDLLRRAPERLLQAGVGDMLAKYISICEWRISHIINGEYYCDRIASLVRRSVDKCLRSAEGLLRRDVDAVANVMEGLILVGVAMNLAGVSRPASGMEHYFSHILDVRALERHGRPEYHGIQVGVGTMLCLRIYAFISDLVPDRQRALDSVGRFDYRQWEDTLRGFLGSGAEELIRRESVEGKYDKAKHRKRLEVIIERWPKIREIIAEELPAIAAIEEFMRSLGMPVEPAEIGVGKEEAALTFRATKDIRDKYIASRLLWDLGVLEEAAERL